MTTPTPGVYYQMPFTEYLAADAVSMSALSTLLDSFPARLLYDRPRTKPMEDGNIAHRLVLEGVDISESDRYIVVPSGFSMRHTSKHSELIEHINATGATPISEDRVETIRAMAAVLRNDPQIAQALSNGKPEVSVFWREERHGLLCKARFDWLPKKGRLFPDYKTTTSIDEDQLARQIKNLRIAHRSAWYQEAAAKGLGREDPLYLPIWQEKTEPYFATMRHVEPIDVEMARLEVDEALALYAHCKATDYWPGPEQYNLQPIGLPEWERKRLTSKYQDEMAVRLQEPETKDEAA